MTTSPKLAARMVRPSVGFGATLVSCLALTAVPVASADPIADIRARADGIRNESCLNAWNYSGELEGYAMSWVRTARSLGTLDTPTFPADAYPGEDAIGSIAAGDPTVDATNELMSFAAADIRSCGYYEYGVGMIRDDIIDTSYVAIIVGKPKTVDTPQGPPVNNLPPGPAPEPEPQPQPEPEPAAPVQPTATVLSDVDVYDAPGGNGNVTGILRQAAVVDFWGCIEEQWCHVTGAAVPNGDGWVWGEFLQR